MLRRGAVTYKFTCPKVVVQILQSDKCYTDIPVMKSSDGRALWVSPVTRLIRRYSTPAPCSVHFPLVIQEEGLFLELPTLRPMTAPLNQSIMGTDEEGNKMIDLARGGLYTHEEVSAWEDLLAFPIYHTALLRSLSLGTCISKQLCTQVADQPGYDLDSIMDEQLSWRNPWEKLQRELEKWGGRCSIIMLAYLIVRTLVDIILLSLTAKKMR